MWNGRLFRDMGARFAQTRFDLTVLLTLKHEKTGNNLHSSDYPFIWKEGVEYENHWLEATTIGRPFRLELLRSVRHWLDALEVREPRVARLLCKLIPAQCPFERDIKLFGKSLSYATVVQAQPALRTISWPTLRSMCYLEGIADRTCWPTAKLGSVLNLCLPLNW